MVAFADTGFIASLYLNESTTARAEAVIQAAPVTLPVTPLILLELRNVLNRSVHQKNITAAQRDALWQDIESDIASGFLALTPVDSEKLHRKAGQLSDRHTPTIGTRSLDLLHIAAALMLESKVFYSFDERQRKAAASEGLKVRP